MDADKQDLARHLFVLAAEIIEAAHETAIAGQRPELTAPEIAASARALGRHADRLTIIARTILITTEAETECNQADRTC